MNNEGTIEPKENGVQTILLVPEIVINERLKFLAEAAEVAEKLNNYHEQTKYQYAEKMFKNFFEKMEKVRVNLTELNKKESL